MQGFQGNDSNRLPPVVKNLLILNAILFLGKLALYSRGIDLDDYLALFYPGSMHFKPIQILTHFFMHGSFTHILFNMFGVWMFGRLLETVWGAKRFLFFYMVTAFAAAVLHYGVVQYQVMGLEKLLSAEQIEEVYSNGRALMLSGRIFGDPTMQALNYQFNIPVLGASGALFGLLGACFVLFPNSQLYLLFPPIPIKMKYFVIFYGLFELFGGIAARSGDNVAHFAHLGGLIAGILIVKYWNKSNSSSLF